MPKKTDIEYAETDHAHTLARAGIGSLPIFGNAAVELLKSLVTPLARDRARAGAVLAPV